jgi:hypothetical protein
MCCFSNEFTSNETTLTPTSFASTTSDLDVSFEFSFRPIFEVNVTISGDEHHSNVTADLPRLDVIVSQVSNVDASCSPAGPEVASDKIFAKLTQVTPSLSVDIGLDLDGKVYEANLTDSTLPTGYFQFDHSSNALVAPKGSSSTGGASGLSASVLFALAVALLVAVVFGRGSSPSGFGTVPLSLLVSRAAVRPASADVPPATIS